MGDTIRQKVATLIEMLERRYGKPERPMPSPPPSSADAAANAAVAQKNAQVVASVVLGLHGPPAEGAEASRKLMGHFVDWNEVRVARMSTLVSVLGRQPRAEQRVTLLQRFLEAYFLRQRSRSLDYLFSLKTPEVRRFLSDLEVFDREELAAVFLVGFNVPAFPPSDVLRETARNMGLINDKVTTLQMAKKFETSFESDVLFELYSHLYSLACDPEGQKLSLKKPKAPKKNNNNSKK